MLSDAEKGLCLVGLVLGAWLIWLLTPILFPFLAGTILAYLGDPIVDRIEQRRIGRNWAVSMVFALLALCILSLLLVILPIVEGQLARLLQRAPEMLDTLWRDYAMAWAEKLGFEEHSPGGSRPAWGALGQHGEKVGNIAGMILSGLGRSGQVLLLWLGYLLIIPVVTFYLLRDWDRLVERIVLCLPLRIRDRVCRIGRECDEVLAAFLRGQLLVMLGLGLLYSAGLWLAGIEFALLIGLFAGLVSFVPYLGCIVGIALATLTALFQYHDILHVVYVLCVFGIGQAIEGMVLTPLLVGDRVRLHPVAVIFAVMAGGQLFGLFGMLLALPVAAVCMVLCRHAWQRYRHRVLQA